MWHPGHRKLWKCCFAMVVLSPFLVAQAKAEPAATQESRSASSTGHNRGSQELVSLADSIDPLVKQFNKDAGRYRLVALLSPT